MKPKKISDIGEFGLIDQIRKEIKTSQGVVKGIGDDAAVMQSSPGKLILFTTDMLVEGVHFSKSDSLSSVGRKAICCSVSDIAAMGGIPKYAVVSIGIAGNTPIKKAQQISAGINKAAMEYDVVIVGGDTVKSKKLVINVSIMGEAKKSELITRSGAKVGHQIFVTGKLGGSLTSRRHLTFVPRLEESQYLAKHYKPTAMIDISDGLISDLQHVLDESKAGAVIYETLIPKYRNVKMKNALCDGEDFELLFTVSKKRAARLIKDENIQVFHIGEILNKEEGLQLVDKKGKREDLTQRGFTHF